MDFRCQTPSRCLTYIYFSIILIPVGRATNNSGKAMTKPPMIAIAKGWCIWAPVPIPNARGNSAVIAPNAVISFGLNLVEIENIIESSLEELSLSF